MAEVVDHPRFVAMLAERFPAVAADIDSCAEGLLHLEMGTFARATQKAISGEDVPTVKAHFAFVNEVYRQADPGVKNAVHVSYLERLSFDGRHGKKIRARELLSPLLRDALRRLEEYLAELFREVRKK